MRFGSEDFCMDVNQKSPRRPSKSNTVQADGARYMSCSQALDGFPHLFRLPSTHMLRVSLLGAGTVLRFRNDVWLMFKRRGQAAKEYAHLPPSPTLHAHRRIFPSLMVMWQRTLRNGDSACKPFAGEVEFCSRLVMTECKRG